MVSGFTRGAKKVVDRSILATTASACRGYTAGRVVVVFVAEIAIEVVDLAHQRAELRVEPLARVRHGTDHLGRHLIGERVVRPDLASWVTSRWVPG